MNKLFENISKLSWPMVMFIASSISLVIILPLWLVITSRKTNVVSRAVKQAPLTISVKPTPVTGPIPAQPPVITRVYPWVGKTEDAIIIEGRYFGAFPKNRRLAIGGVVVPDADISQWTDTIIAATIPENPQQGMPVSLRIDTYPMVESVPLVFYDEKTKTQLHKQGNQLSLSGITGTVKAILYIQNGRREAIITNPQPTTHNLQLIPLFTLAPSEDIQSILLRDEKGILIPYRINPTEFGF